MATNAHKFVMATNPFDVAVPAVAVRFRPLNCNLKRCFQGPDGDVLISAV